MLNRRLIFGILWNTIAFGTALFLPARTFDWWRAWVLLGVLFVASLVTIFGGLSHAARSAQGTA